MYKDMMEEIGKRMRGIREKTDGTYECEHEWTESKLTKEEIA